MKQCPHCGLQSADDQVFCQQCGTRLAASHQTNSTDGQLLQEEKKQGSSKKRILLTVILAAACVFSIVFSVIQYNNASFYSNLYDSLYFRYSDLAEENTVLAEQAEFLDQYIAIIDNDSGDNLYHTYTCATWNWDGDWSIIAYNVNKAEFEGYEPCPECH